MKTRPYLPLLIALILYSVAALYHLDLPGLHHDEAQEAGLMGMQLKNGFPPTLFRETSVIINNRAFPIMVQDYIGALNIYLAWIAFGIGGVSVVSLRLMTIFTGALTLITAFGATRRLAGEKAAALAVILLAVHPTFIFWTRQGVFVTSYIQTLALGSLWLLLRWWQGGRSWNLWLAAFLMGVGLWGKLLFIWFILAVGAAWLILNLLDFIQKNLNRQDAKSAKKNLKNSVFSVSLWFKPFVNYSSILIIASICFLIGAAPLIEYNRQSGGTFKNITGNFDQSYYGVDNANVGENFRERLRQTPIVFESGHLVELGGQFPNPISRYWLYLTGLACVIAATISREKRGARLFIVLVVIFMIAQSSFTSTALWYTHFALVLPFMVMMGAIGVSAVSGQQSAFGRFTNRPYKQTHDIGVGAHRDAPNLHANPTIASEQVSGFSLLKLAAAIFITILIAFDLLSTAQYHQAIEKTGGLHPHSAAIYDLTAELDALPPLTPVAAMDWGISPAVAMLTESRVVPNEIFGYSWEADPGFEARVAPFLELDESIYVFHAADSQTLFPRKALFFQLAEAAGKTPILIKTINTRTGDPYFELWKAE